MAMTLPEIRTKGWKALVKELGIAGATKFILLCEKGKGNYVKQRKILFKNVTIDQIYDDIEKKKIKSK